MITFHGEIPKSSVPDDAGVRREIVEVDSASRGIRHVVVYLTQTNGPRISLVGPSDIEDSKVKPLVDQQSNEFTPRIIAVREGQHVIFSNSNPANHNVRTIAAISKNEFNIFTGADGKYEHRFVVEPEYRPVRLGCDIHPWMRGWVFVFDHPYFAITDERGRFRISQVPSGEHVLHIVQPDIRHRERRNIVLATNETCRVEVVIGIGAASRP